MEMKKEMVLPEMQNQLVMVQLLKIYGQSLHFLVSRLTKTQLTL